MNHAIEEAFLKPIVVSEIERVAWPPSWLGHAPFALWLIDELRPRNVVELGSHTGNSFSAFCQAVRALGSATKCFAIDTWEGDPHAGSYGGEVYAELLDYIQRNYADFAQLIRKTFNEALNDFADGSIDLLNIDGYHTYEATRENFVNWLPKMSERGVILLHDTNVRVNDFGAWKLWEEIQERYPSFEFLHSHGLGVVAVGSEVTNGLRALFDCSAGEEAYSRVRRFFSSLGSSPVARSALLYLQQQLRRGSAPDGAASSSGYSIEQDQLTAVITEERERRIAIEATLTQQAAKISTLLAQLESQAALVNESKHEVTTLQRSLRVVTTDRDAHKVALAKSKAEVAAQHKAYAECRTWKTFVRENLGPTLPQAQARLGHLIVHDKAMNSPSHRLLSRIIRRLTGTFLGRSLRRIFHLMVAVRRA